jgi:AraC-like DNA-binding protein
MEEQASSGPITIADQASGPEVRSEFFTPPEEFEGCFTTFYHLEVNLSDGLTIEDYLQPEWANIRFFCEGVPNAQVGESKVAGFPFVATGPSSLPCRFELGKARMWGIGFMPLGWARFIDSDARSLANLVCDGSTHPAFAKFAELMPALCKSGLSMEQQYDAIIAAMRRLARPHRDEAKIARVHQAIVDPELLTVAELADASGMSIRSLERVCERFFGFPPKLLMRRQRFMRTLSAFMLQKDRRWTGAMDDHYYDQAQFSREFAEFMTMNPSEYASRDHPILSAFMEARARLWGSAAQTLDKPSRK